MSASSQHSHAASRIPPRSDSPPAAAAGTKSLPAPAASSLSSDPASSGASSSSSSSSFSSSFSSSVSASTPSTQDALRIQYERLCGEMQMAGRRLQRQMQDYQAALAEIRELEQDGSPQARAKLARLDALLDSESFQREEREIGRMAASLANAIERLRAQMPASLSASADRSPGRPAAKYRACV